MLDDNGNDDNAEKDDDADCDDNSHLHVLPPHLLADSVGASSEALGGYGEVVSLVLKAVEILATLVDLVDVVAHDRDGVIDLGVNTSRLGVGKVGTAARRIGASVSRRDVGVITAVVLGRHGVVNSCVRAEDLSSFETAG